MRESNAPYISLGNHLKYVREQAKQTLAEVSGAVEIDENALERIEAGMERPDEEVLMLLISHFGVADREAIQLWELADYDSEMPDEIRGTSSSHKQTIMLLVDVRTMYSDGVDISVNQAGVTLSFTQASGPDQSATVARLGMSIEQAENVARALEQALLHAKYASKHKMLPPPQEHM